MLKIIEGANLNILKKTCPTCGHPMIIRLAKKGAYAGLYFWGCTQYPRCNKTLNLTDEEISKINSTVKSPNQTKSATTVEDQIEMPILTKPFKAKSCIDGYYAFFFQSLALPVELFSNMENDKIDYQDLLFYSKFRVDYISKQYSVSNEKRAILSLILRLLNRGKITLNSSEIEEKLKRHFNITNIDRFDLTKLDNYLNYHNVIDNIDSENEKVFIEKCIKKVFGTSWASHVMTQAHLESLVDGLDLKGQRVDFILSQNKINYIIELNGKEHKNHVEKDAIRDESLKLSGYPVLRIKNEELLDADRQINKLKQCGFISTEFESFNNYEKFLVASKIIHQLEIAIIKGLEQGYIRFEENISLYIDSPYFSQKDLDVVLQMCLNDINHLINNFSNIYNIDLQINLHNKKENAINITFGNAINGGRQIIIRDISIKDNILCSLEQFDNIKPIKCDKKTLKYFLSYIFRFKDFQEGQYEAIERVINKKDSIILLPTGSGKSLIYQLTSLIVSGLTVVISPITSLMDDQIENLLFKGIDNSLKIYSAVDTGILDNTYELLVQKNTSLLYISPERLQIVKFRNLIKKMLVENSIYTVAIDEAHCVSEWGHDFRTSYLNIGRNAREFFKKNGEAPVITALTGTASTAVLKDVQRELQIDDIDAIITPKTFDRKELSFKIIASPSDSKSWVLTDLLTKQLPEMFNVNKQEFHRINDEKTYCGIVFCPNVNGDFGVTNVSQEISSTTSLKVGLYSGRAPKDFGNETKWNKIKSEYATNFKRNNLNILVATKAFGMGIDKPNIRYTIHYGIPGSIESFYQEAGRAGRDRKDSKCIVIFSNDNTGLNELLLSAGNSLEEVKSVCMGIKYDQNDDISRMLYFHVSSFKGIDEENKLVNEIIDKIYTTEDIHVYLIAQNERNDLEKAIQRLVILGVIKDYSVDYSSNEYNIEKYDITKEEIINNYCKYVRGYNEGRVLIERKKLESYQNRSLIDFIRQASKILVEFVYDTIEKGRRRALREMYELSKEAILLENQDEVIRRRITRYFDSSYSSQLDEILNKGEINLLDIIIVFDGTIFEGEQVGGIRSISEVESIRGQTARYLESIPDHPSLLFIRSLSELYLDNSNIQTILQDFQNAIDFSITRYSVDSNNLDKFIVYFLNKAYQKKSELYERLLAVALNTIENKMRLIRELINSETIVDEIRDLPLLLYSNVSINEIIYKIK